MTDLTMGDAPPAEPSAATAKPMSVAYRRYALALLVAIYTVNFLDRQVVTLLIEPIKSELKLDDFQVGAMGGLWFALLYTVLGIPIARWLRLGTSHAAITRIVVKDNGVVGVASFNETSHFSKKLLS